MISKSNNHLYLSITDKRPLQTNFFFQRKSYVQLKEQCLAKVMVNVL